MHASKSSLLVSWPLLKPYMVHQLTPQNTQHCAVHYDITCQKVGHVWVQTLQRVLERRWEEQGVIVTIQQPFVAVSIEPAHSALQT